MIVMEEEGNRQLGDPGRFSQASTKASKAAMVNQSQIVGPPPKLTARGT
jgi:hypothetical protein